MLMQMSQFSAKISGILPSAKVFSSFGSSAVSVGSNVLHSAGGKVVPILSQTKTLAATAGKGSISAGKASLPVIQKAAMAVVHTFEKIAPIAGQAVQHGATFAVQHPTMTGILIIISLVAFVILFVIVINLVFRDDNGKKGQHQNNLNHTTGANGTPTAPPLYPASSPLSLKSPLKGSTTNPT